MNKIGRLIQYQTKTITGDSQAELLYKAKGYDIRGWFVRKKYKPYKKDGKFCVDMHRRKPSK